VIGTDDTTPAGEHEIPASPEAAAELKSGWKTTEFWIAVAMKLLGAWLISKGKDELGVMLITISGGGYMGSRTLAKRQPRLVG
jgi:hypothetical protein